MFNVKALWWTILFSWILGSVYWHVCKLKLLCDELRNTRLFPTEVVSPEGEPANSPPLPDILSVGISTDHMIQYAVMILVTIVLAYFTGKSYEYKKTRELRYKLNRINKELKYFESKK